MAEEISTYIVKVKRTINNVLPVIEYLHLTGG